MFALYQKHAFGNCLRKWQYPHDLVNSGYTGTVVLRYLDGPGGRCHYHLPIITALMLWELETKMGHKVFFEESMDDTAITIQGELIEGETSSGIWMQYSHKKTNMRAAMRDPLVAEGLRARLLLKHFLTPASYDDLQEVLDAWPYHVVEFTACDKQIGWTRGRNCVIWETRLY